VKKKDHKILAQDKRKLQKRLAPKAYMVIAALAWSLKNRYGLLVPELATGQAIVRMEFKRFLRAFILIPCQVVHTGRRLILRVLTYTRHLEIFFKTFDLLKRLRFA
jgi:hypothetical protein